MPTTRASLRRRHTAVLLVAAAWACDGSYSGPGGISGGTAHTLVSASLAATPFEGISTYTLYIAKIQAVSAADTTVRFTIAGTPLAVDLLALADTVSPVLGTVSVPVGDYVLRLVVDSARLAFAPPMTFVNGDTARTLPIPVALRGGVPVIYPLSAAGTRVTVVINVDAARSLLYTGTVTNPTSAILSPVMHGVVDTVAASITGKVLPVSSLATLYGIVNDDTVATALADTAGMFTLRLLPPGDVLIDATGIGLAAQKTVTVVAGQDTTGIIIP